MYLRELAEAMDDRTRRLGQHAAATQPPWARHALGPLPADPTARLDWEHRASIIAAYRERYGHDHPADPIGPEPAATSPEARAAWHGALTALGRIDGIDLRRCTDGELWLRRSTYERETAWAPPHVTAALRAARTAARDARVHAIRAEHEARATRNRDVTARHRDLASRWHAVEAKAAAEARIFTDIQDTRRRWDQLTQSTRRIAIAADNELRRRHLGKPIAPLRPHSAEATQEFGLSTHARRDNPSAPTPDLPTTLGLTLDNAHTPIPSTVQQVWHAARATRAEIDKLASLREPADEHDHLEPGLAWPDESSRQRAAILQPPSPEISPSDQVTESYQRAASRTAEPEREAG